MDKVPSSNSASDDGLAAVPLLQAHHPQPCLPCCSLYPDDERTLVCRRDLTTVPGALLNQQRPAAQAQQFPPAVHPLQADVDTFNKPESLRR
jgi:hypothetical protein